MAGEGYIGCYVLGMGFIVDPEEAQEWIAADPRNAEVLFPYLNGEDLNSRPDSSASRWVIDFNDRSEEQAAEYEIPFRRVLEQVKPERMKNNRKVYRDRWWQYAEKRPAMREKISHLEQVLAITLVSNTVMPIRVSRKQIFSHALGVYATESFSDQAILPGYTPWPVFGHKLGIFTIGDYSDLAVFSSGVHFAWVSKYTSTLGAGINYSPSDVFETFPRPLPTDKLNDLGEKLEYERNAIAKEHGIGLTKIYNYVNGAQPTGTIDVSALRAIHSEIDSEVLSSFGWSDIDPRTGLYEIRNKQRWVPSTSARIEVLERLLELNRERIGAG